MRHVEALARGLPAEGMVCGLASPAPPDWVGRERGGEVRWRQVALDDRMLSALAPRTVSALRAVWCRERWDLVHAHGYKAAVLAWMASRASSSMRYVATFHNLCPPAGRLGSVLLSASVRGACRTLGVSQAVIDSLGAGTGSAVSGTVIPNGVDWQRLAVLPPRTESRRGLGLSEEAVILFLGRLTAEKGVRVLAEAAAALRRQREDIVVLIAGDGPERGRLEGAAHATPSLRLLGAREDVPELMSACDLVVVPSLREGQSLVALEAMAAGRPLLVSGVGGLAELAAASGACWTVAPGQPGELAHGLASLLAQPQERANLAARGLAYAQEHGDWRQMVRRVAAVYRESMEDR